MFTDDIGTSKTYDRTEYFKIKDQIREIWNYSINGISWQ
jgi:hypothetical protein